MSDHAEQGGLFSMMGTADAQLKNKKPAAPAQTQQSQGQKKGKGPKTFPKISVYYAGNTIDLPRSGMTVDEVHAFLEQDYRELAKEHSELIHDEKRGLLIAHVKGHKKGASAAAFLEDAVPLTVLPEPPAPHSPRRRLFHVLADDGVYEGRRTQVGTFAARVPSPLRAQSGFELAVAKPPAALLAEIVSGFRATPRVERLANVLYRGGRHGGREGVRQGDGHGSHEVHWPDQDGTPVSVEAPGLLETDETFTVVQVHSHGYLPAYFSDQDDSDEVRTGLFGVVGRCHAEISEMVFRFSVNGLYGFASAAEIFAESRRGELAAISRDLRPYRDANRKEGIRWASPRR